MKKLNPNRVLIEATGRLEMPFAIAAFKAGLPMVVCNAAQVHDFSKAAGTFAKTDKLDAFTIAEYGERMTPELSDIKPDDLLKISELITVRTQCLEIVK